MADQASGRPAGWKRDPSGRHYGRWWDGEGWTENVISAEKVQGVDPLQPRPPETISAPPPPARQAAPPPPPPAPAVGAPDPGKRRVPLWVKIAVPAVVVIALASAGGDDKETVTSDVAPTTVQATEDQPATTKAPTTKAPPPPTTAAGPKTTFGNGQYRVGTDIAPGTYVAPGGRACYWERQSTFGGSGVRDIIANDLSSGGQVLVTIEESDKGFKTSGCGTWQPG